MKSRGWIIAPVGGDDPDMPDEDMGSELAETIAALAKQYGIVIGVAESLTSGAIAVALGKATEASEWFAGAIVAYMPSVKFDLLGSRPGPVVTATTALQMAQGARKRLQADIAVAVTGVGGPGKEEGHPAGTVFIGIADDNGAQVSVRRFMGSPSKIVTLTVRAALELLLEALTSAVSIEKPRAQ